jgi:FAD synthase
MYIKETTGKNVNLDDHNQMFTAVQEKSHIVADIDLQFVTFPFNLKVSNVNPLTFVEQ